MFEDGNRGDAVILIDLLTDGWIFFAAAAKAAATGSLGTPGTDALISRSCWRTVFGAVAYSCASGCTPGPVETRRMPWIDLARGRAPGTTGAEVVEPIAASDGRGVLPRPGSAEAFEALGASDGAGAEVVEAPFSGKGAAADGRDEGCTRAQGVSKRSESLAPEITHART